VNLVLLSAGGGDYENNSKYLQVPNTTNDEP